MRYLWRIFNIRRQDHISNTEDPWRGGIPSVKTLLVKAQLRRAGHVLCMDASRIPKAMSYRQLKCVKRGKWRPRLRLNDTLKANLKECGFNLTIRETDARNRIQWRASCHAACKLYLESRGLRCRGEQLGSPVTPQQAPERSTATNAEKNAFYVLGYHPTRGLTDAETLIHRAWRETPFITSHGSLTHETDVTDERHHSLHVMFLWQMRPRYTRFFKHQFGVLGTKELYCWGMFVNKGAVFYYFWLFVVRMILHYKLRNSITLSLALPFVH